MEKQKEYVSKRVGCHLTMEEREKLDYICDYYDCTLSMGVRKAINSLYMTLHDKESTDREINASLKSIAASLNSISICGVITR